jgi:hypothetical protein
MMPEMGREGARSQSTGGDLTVAYGEPSSLVVRKLQIPQVARCWEISSWMARIFRYANI